MMISPIEKLDFIFGKARDEFEMKILISSPIVKTTLFSLLLTRNINWKLIKNVSTPVLRDPWTIHICVK